jgi:hypothetical protein
MLDSPKGFYEMSPYAIIAVLGIHISHIHNTVITTEIEGNIELEIVAYSSEYAFSMKMLVASEIRFSI